jgi:uncharacterized protein (TIGR02145 family)
MNAFLRSGLQLGLILSALSLAVSCQNSTSPEPSIPAAPTGDLQLSFSISDTALVPDAIDWSLKGRLQVPPTFSTTAGKIEITLPTSSIGADTAVLELSRFGIRTHVLRAWTKSPPILAVSATSDTAGIRVLQEYLRWKAEGRQNQSLLDYLATSILDSSLTPSERTRIMIEWTSSSLDSAALAEAVRRGFALDSLLPRWSGALGRDQALALIREWKAAGTITNAQYDAMLPTTKPTTSKDDTPPVIALIGATGDGYTVDTDTARIAFTVSDSSPLRSVKVGSEILADTSGRFELLMRDLVVGTPRSIELIALDTAGNEARKTVTVTRRASTTLGIAGLPDSVRIPEDSSRNLAFRPACPAGSECVLSVRSADTSLVTATFSATSSTTSGSTLKLVPAPDHHGNTTVSVELSSGSRSVVALIVVDIAPVNDAPSLEVVRSLSGRPSDTLHFPSWLVSSRSGPPNESEQKLTYLVGADSGANLLARAPSIDAQGGLVVVGKGISGTVVLSVRARDDGDSAAPHSNTSASRRIVLRLDTPPTLRAPASVAGAEDTRLDLGIVEVEDFESPTDLDFSWTILDETLVPRSDVRIRAATGGYAMDLLPAPNRSGKTRIAFHVKDPAGGEAFDTTDIEIEAVNDSPVIASASDLPDTIVIPSTSSDTTLPKLFGDIAWEPTSSTQTGTWSIALADTTQAKFFSFSSNKDGIEPTGDGGVRLRIKIDTTMLVRLVVTATDDGGTENAGANTGRRTILVKYTNTVKDVDGNTYTYRRMPDGNHWMEQNIRTKARNGDTRDSCAGDLLGRTPSCSEFGRLYTWQQAMNLSPTCTGSECIASLTDNHKGLCPEGWRVANSANWSNLFERTMEPGSSDSSYNLRSIDTSWSNYYSASSPMRYPGSGKYGDFLDPVADIQGSISGARGATGGSIVWMPRFPPGYSGNPEVPPALKITWVASQEYGGVSIPYASLRCLR